MPLAPASTLYLYDVEFMKFRVNLEPGQPNRAERIDPSPAVREDLSRFRRESSNRRIPGVGAARVGRVYGKFAIREHHARTHERDHRRVRDVQRKPRGGARGAGAGRGRGGGAREE